MRLSVRFLWVVTFCLSSNMFPPGSYCQEKTEPSEVLELSYQDFDQSPGKGWRKVALQGKFLDAAKLIDRYEREKQGLNQSQRVNLRFHAGQLYAFADRNKQAIDRFKKAVYAKEPPNSPIRWNAYVQATIAFLERDRGKLVELREEIAKGPKQEGIAPNLAVVDRLIEHFGQPYAVAYGGKKKPKCAE